MFPFFVLELKIKSGEIFLKIKLNLKKIARGPTLVPVPPNLVYKYKRTGNLILSCTIASEAGANGACSFDTWGYRLVYAHL